jgi:hypothetical protein
VSFSSITISPSARAQIRNVEKRPATSSYTGSGKRLKSPDSFTTQWICPTMCQMNGMTHSSRGNDRAIPPRFESGQSSKSSLDIKPLRCFLVRLERSAFRVALPLFPLGIGVNRLLTRSGNIPASWRARLDTLLGTQDWYDKFYRVEHQPTLFGTDEERVVKATTETIGRYFTERLKSVFPGVAEPGVLRNSANCPLYLLCFAAGNVKGEKIALKIANHLLKELH